MRGRRWSGIVLAAAACLLARDGFAQDKPPGPGAPPTQPKPGAPAAAPTAADSLDAQVDGVHRLVAQSAWKSGRDAVLRILKSGSGDPRVLARLPELEDALRRCVWGVLRKPPSPVEVLGRGATKAQAATRTATFQCDPTKSDGWTAVRVKEGTYCQFDVPFDGDVAIRIDTGAGSTFLAVLCLDDAAGTGYTLACSERSDSSTGSTQRSATGAIQRLGPDGSKLLADNSAVMRLGAAGDIEFERRGNALEVVVDGKVIAKATDPKHRRGNVAVLLVPGLLGEKHPLVRGVTVEGTVDERFWKRLAAEHENASFREWRKEGWDRAKELPAWVLEAEKKASSVVSALPKDAPAEHAGFLRALVRAFYEGDAYAVEAGGKMLPPMPPATKSYVAGIIALSRGAWADADEGFRLALGWDPVFGPAYTGLARALYERGQAPDARRVLEDAVRLAPDFAPTWDLLADLAIFDGDLAAAEKALAEGAARGVATSRTRELRDLLLRIRRGPAWPKRFEHRTEHFLVASDHSKDVCVEVGKKLEDALASYHAKFRPLSRKQSARVHVFAGESGYLAHMEDLGGGAEGTAGVYIPSLREMALFLHEDREVLWDTVRHEGFHQYLHNFLPDAPIWFNEGYAEYFGFSRRVGGVVKTGQTSEMQKGVATTYRPQFSAYPELFLMDAPTFMGRAGPHYVQSWAVVRTLRESKDPRLKGVLEAYFDALLAGRSRSEAYELVLRPALPAIESAVNAFLDSL